MGFFSAGENKEAKALRADAKANMDKAIAALEAVGIPSIEAQKIIMESPELVGLEQYKDLGPSAMQDLFADSKYVQEQEATMEGLKERAETGVTAAEKAQRRDLLDSVANQEQSRQKTIMRQMAEKGQSGGGAELAAMLQSSQSAADRGSRQASDLASQAENRALQALTQKGDLAGQLRSQAMGEGQSRASAADRIAQMNWQASQDAARRNLQSRQNISNVGTQTRNQEQMHNKGLIQQDFQNRMAKAGGKSGAYTGQANMLNQQAAAQPKETSTLQDIGSIASAAGSIGSLFAEGGVAKKDPTSDKDKKPATKIQGMFAKNELEARQNILNGEGPGETHKQYEDRVIRDDMNARYKPAPVKAANGAVMDPGAGFQAGTKLDAIKYNEANGIDRTTGEAFDAAKQEFGALGDNISSGFSSLLDKFKANKAAVPQDEMVGPPAPEAPSTLDKLGGAADSLGKLAAPQQATPAPSYQNVAAPQLDIPQGNMAAEAAQNMRPQYKDGGMPRYMDGGSHYNEGGLDSDSTGELIPGESFANDRVDAKLNSGEMVLNVKQQQRLLDLLRGEATEAEVLDNGEDIIPEGEASEEDLSKLMAMIGLEK